MNAPALSNYLADLAERAGDAFRRGRARTIEAAAAYLDCGRILAEAKAECGHGQWLPFLERADIPERTGQRMMRLAASGIAAEVLAERGIRAALAQQSRPRKSVTVTDLSRFEPPRPATPDPAARARERRAARRAQGRCVDCGAVSDGKARCPDCRADVARRDRRRRALARTGAVLAPRLAEAASAGTGLALSPAEVAELAGETNAPAFDDARK